MSYQSGVRDGRVVVTFADGQEIAVDATNVSVQLINEWREVPCPDETDCMAVHRELTGERTVTITGKNATWRTVTAKSWRPWGRRRVNTVRAWDDPRRSSGGW